MKTLKQVLPGQLLGRYVNAIKQRKDPWDPAKDLSKYCALSLLIECEGSKHFITGDPKIPQAFYDEPGLCDALIQSFEANKNWGDVLQFALQT